MRCAAIAWIAVVAWMSSARAGGFPALDEQVEKVIVGPKVAALPTAAMNGEWNLSPSELTPKEGKKGLQNWWFPSGVNLADGFVRARMTAKGGLDAGLFFRAALPASGEPPGALTGYLVSVESNEVALEMWERGTRRELLPAAKVRTRAGVEVVAWMIGPQLRVDVYDAGTLSLVTSFAMNAPQLVDGQVGYWASGLEAAKQSLVLLAVTPAKVKGAARDEPAGPQRYLRMARSTLDGLSSDVRPQLTVAEKIGDEVVVKASVEAHELLKRAGVAATWVQSDTPHKYIDRSYLEAQGRPVEKTATGFRIDRSYKDVVMVEALLRAYAERFPEYAKLVELGRSNLGRPIWALKVSDHVDESEPDEPAVLLDGSHHGDELMPIENVMDALQVLLEQRKSDPMVKRLVDSLEIWLVPLVNPDGNWAFLQESFKAGRKNGRDTDGNHRWDPNDGVDLNRNYPFAWGALGESGSRSFRGHEWYRGPFAASEPETRALMRLVDAEVPIASVSYHTVSNVILVPYTTNGPKNPEPNEAWVVAEEIAAALPDQPTGKRMGVAKQIYAVDGVDQDHFRATHGTLALLVEGATHNPLGAGLKRRQIESTRGTWRTLLERVVTGPTLSGNVRDANGRALHAEVVVKELAPKNGEHWTTRCRDGRFDRVLPRAGTFTLEVRAAGYKPLTQRVNTSKPTKLDIRLEPDASPAMPALCGDRALLSIDAACACELGTCIEPGPAEWCRIEGACVRAGARRAGACGVCDPSVDQRAWSGC